MSIYSIKQLEQLSGIKAHTIRIWEQRYKLFSPERSETNIRTYDDEDLRKILNVCFLKDNGYKLPEIAEMRAEELAQTIEKLTLRPETDTARFHALKMSMIEMDEDKFEKIIHNTILKRGFEETMLEVVYPFLQQIGTFWLTGDILPAQEHFMSNLLRQKIISAIDGQITPPDNKRNRIFLFCPEGEWHELGLLFAHYLLRKRNLRSYYLGANVPLDNIVQLSGPLKPTSLIINITISRSPEEMQAYVHQFSELFPGQTIYLTGRAIFQHSIHYPKNINALHSFQSLITWAEAIQTNSV